jgi:hydroxymethylpyrimidine/phosphomethylpyrimidine kinase
LVQTPPVALTIAGSDSGGGAGIQADLRTFHQFGVYGTSVVTAITAQNTVGVTAVEPVSVETVRAQLAAVRDDLPPSALKSGMLFGTGIIEAVAEGIDGLPETPYVLDPVMISTSGHRLIDEDAQAALLAHLVPRAAVVTPNLHECAVLTGLSIESIDDMKNAAERLVLAGANAVLLKGGHLPGDEVADLLVGPGIERLWRRPRLSTPHTHGTGCTLSAAIAAGLAKGRALEQATCDALGFLVRAIETAPGLGSGHGPLNPFVRPE